MSTRTLYYGALKTHWRAYATGTLALLAANFTEVITPKFVEWGIDIVQGKPYPYWLGRGATDRRVVLESLVAAFGAVLVIGLVGRIGWRQFLARRTHMAGRDLKVRIWRSLRGAPLHTLRAYSVGDLMNRATADWNASREIHGFTVVMTLDLIFVTVMALFSMFLIDPVITVVALVAFPVVPRLIMKLAREQRRQHLMAQERLSALSDRITQTLAAVRLTRATGSDALWRSTLNADAKAYAAQRYEVVRTGWRIYPLSSLPTLVAYFVLLALGIGRLHSGTLSIGAFVALLSYVLMLQGPIAELGDCIGEWQRGFASFGRLVELFGLETRGKVPRPSESLPALASGVAIELRALSFAYPEQVRPVMTPVLDRVNLRISPGTTVGIVGPIGGGKSTLLSLLGGLFEAPQGGLLLDGQDQAHLSREWFAAHVAMVPQRPFLFAGTLRANLNLDLTHSDAELWRVLDAVHMADEVRAFELALDARVGEWGINLSGGQKQRLALARALLRPRRLYLLDDCLSAVDVGTEGSILADLPHWLRGATCIQVAHRESTIKGCDLRLKLIQGRLQPLEGDLVG